MNDTPVSRERMLECLNELERRGIEWEKEGMNEPGMRDSIYAIGEGWIRRTKERVEAIRTLISEPNADDEQTAPPDEGAINLDDLCMRCELCGEILTPKVSESDDEIIVVEPCDCILDKPPTERGEGDTCGFCNGPTRHITDGDWCTRCGTMNTDESITAPTDDELKPTPGTQWTHECDRCGAIAKNPALMCCAICDEGRMVKINGNG